MLTYLGLDMGFNLSKGTAQNPLHIINEGKYNLSNFNKLPFAQ